MSHIIWLIIFDSYNMGHNLYDAYYEINMAFYGFFVNVKLAMVSGKYGWSSTDIIYSIIGNSKGSDDDSLSLDLDYYIPTYVGCAHVYMYVGLL